MSRLLLSRLARMKPYVPGEQPQGMDRFVKINTNECPYPPSQRVLDALSQAEVSRMNLYPDPLCASLIDALAEFHGLLPEQVYVGNGSDEVLAFAFMAYCDAEHPCIMPTVTYGFYRVYAELYGADMQTVPLREDFSLPVEPFVGCHKNVFIANPNAPTGISLPISDIERIVKSNPDNLVLIDEAYVDFGGESALPLTAKYDNLLIVRTFSKSRALAGGRLGFALGNEALIADLNRVKFSFHPYCVSLLTLKAGEAAVRDTAYFFECIDRIRKTRSYTADALRALGFSMTKSDANFLFVSPPRMTGKAYYLALKERFVLVRYFDEDGLRNHVRVTIGTREQMDRFLDATREILREAKP